LIFIAQPIEARRAIASVWSQEASKLVSALVRERPLEQLKPNRPSLSLLPASSSDRPAGVAAGSLALVCEPPAGKLLISLQLKANDRANRRFALFPS